MPIVHHTGGLIDTVIDINEPDGYGITFNQLLIPELVNAISRALDIYEEGTSLTSLRKKMMSLDFSWDRSAKEYIDLYKSLIIPHAE